MEEEVLVSDRADVADMPLDEISTPEPQDDRGAEFQSSI